MNLKEYIVYASEKPSEKNVSPQVYTCNVFAKNEVMAKSKTFNLLKKKYKIKSSGGVILKIDEVPQYTDVKARTFTVYAVYKVKTAVNHVNKEIRAITRAKAVEKLYQELWSRHSATPDCITVIDIKEISNEEITSKEIQQVINDPKYPIFDKRVASTAPDFREVAMDRV